MQCRASQKGQIILEVLIAFALFMLSIGSVVIATYGADQLSLDAVLSLRALYHAHDAIEQIHGVSEKAFNTLTSSLADYAPYHEDVIVRYANPFGARVDVSEEWDASGGRQEQTTLSTLVSNRQSLPGSKRCNALAGDAFKGSLVGSLTLASANHGTDLDVVGSYAYLAINSTNTGDPDFYIIDISGATNPRISAWINTGPGLAAMRVVGSYAYAANTSRTAQLQVIDIHDPFHPSVAASLKLPGVSGSGTAGVGNSIAYANGKIYLGTTKATGPELHVIDVSDPLHPNEVGSWEADTSINSITEEASRLYVATPSANQLRVLDVADASHMTVVTQVSPSDASTNDGQSALVAGSLLYFGRNAKATSSATAQQLFFLDTGTADALNTLNGIHIGASINDIVGHTGRLALATNDTVDSLQFWNVDDPVHPARISTLHLDAVPVALACDDVYLYTAVNSSHALQIIGLVP